MIRWILMLVFVMGCATAQPIANIERDRSAFFLAELKDTADVSIVKRVKQELESKDQLLAIYEKELKKKEHKILQEQKSIGFASAVKLFVGILFLGLLAWGIWKVKKTG